MRKPIKFVLVWGARAVSFVLTVIGIAGVPDDVGTWGSWWAWLGDAWWRAVLLLLGISGLVFLWGPGRSAVIGLVKQSKRWAIPADLRGNHLQGLTFRLTDVAIDGVIVGKTFEDCTIHGPAVVTAQGVTMWNYCSVDQNNIIAIPKGFPKPSGVIVCKDCMFRRCAMIGISQIHYGTPELVRMPDGSFCSKDMADMMRSSENKTVIQGPYIPPVPPTKKQPDPNTPDSQPPSKGP